MTMKRLLRHTLLVTAACLACSCSREEAETPAQGPVSFGIDTRATGDGVAEGTTYRIMAYDPLTLALEKTGTYRLESLPEEGGVAELTPCVLDNNGNYTGGTPEDNFSGTTKKLSLVFVSPGVKNNDDGSFDVDLGILNSENKCKFVASEYPESKNLGPYGRITMTHPMKECRSRIGFEFYKLKGDGVKEFKIDKLRIAGAGGDKETVRFFPGKRQVRVNGAGEGTENSLDIALDPVADDSQTDANGNPLRYATPEDKLASIVSAIYAPPAVTAEVLEKASGTKVQQENLEKGTYLLMRCEMTQDGREPVAVELPLTAGEWPEILPQRNYVYRVVVSSNYITLSVDIFGDDTNDWEPGITGGGDDTVGGPADRIQIGTWEIVQDQNGNGWELEKLEDQIIGRSDSMTED